MEIVATVDGPERRTIVVDADVARQCSLAGNPEASSSACARVLIAVLRICHRLAVSTAGRKEWERHRSRFFYEWWTDMVSRGKDVSVSGELEPALGEAVVAAVTTARLEGSIRKDLHLLAAALATDGIVFSCDKGARRDFVSASPSVAQLQDIHWVNPQTTSQVEIVAWLEAGAPSRDEWKLGATPNE